MSEISVEKEEEVASYVRLRDQLTNLGEEFHKILTDPQYIVRFMNPGRLVRVKNQDQVISHNESRHGICI